MVTTFLENAAQTRVPPALAVTKVIRGLPSAGVRVGAARTALSLWWCLYGPTRAILRIKKAGGTP